MTLHHYQASLSMSVETPAAALDQFIRFDLEKLLDALADAAIAYEKSEALDYYPALDYLVSGRAVSEELFERLNSACRMSRLIAVDLIQTKLKAAFSRTRVVAVNHPAYHIPRISPRKRDVRAALKRHYRPHLLHVNLQLSQIHKHSVAADYDRFSRHLVHRWLSECFERIEILSIEREA